MGKTTRNAKEVIKAIQGSAGVKTTIAKRLGVTRQTVDSYILRWSSVREAYEEERFGIDDAAVSVIINDIVNNKDVGTAKWWVARKLDEFADKQKVILTWQDEVIDALRNGQLKPEDVKAAFPDLATEFFIKAGINAS